MSVTTNVYAMPVEPLNPERIPQTPALIRHLLEAGLLDPSCCFGFTVYPDHLDRMNDALHDELGVWHHCKTLDELETLWQTTASPRRIASLVWALTEEATIDFVPPGDSDDSNEAVVLHTMGIDIGRHQLNDPTGESPVPILSDHLLVIVHGDGSTADEESLIAVLTASSIGQTLLQWLEAHSGVAWQFSRSFVCA